MKRVVKRPVVKSKKASAIKKAAEKAVRARAMMPSEVKVGIKIFQIVKGDPGESPKGDRFWGVVNYRERLIIIAEDLFAQDVQMTILHEILHALLLAIGRGGLDRVNEGLVNSMECGLFQLIQDNPELMRYLQEKF